MANKIKRIKWSNLVIKHTCVENYFRDYIEDIAPREIHKGNGRFVKNFLIANIHPKNKAITIFHKLLNGELVNVHEQIEMWLPNGIDRNTQQPLFKSTFGRTCKAELNKKTLMILPTVIKDGKGTNGNNNNISTW